MSRLCAVRSTACLAFAIVMAGCAQPPAEVTGTIKLKGQSPNMQGLQIVFMSSDGCMAAAEIAEDGTYKADVPVGEARVGFSYASPQTKARPRLVRPTEGGKPSSPPPNSGKDPIPQALRDPTSSNVTVTIVRGQPNVFNYDIK